MADVTLPDFYFDTVIAATGITLVTVLDPVVTAIFVEPAQEFEGIDSTSVVVTNPS